MFGGSIRYAARAPARALVSAPASLTFAVKASAPLRTNRSSRDASRPTTRTRSPFSSRELAITEPVLPVAPRTTYMKPPRLTEHPAHDKSPDTLTQGLNRLRRN